MRNFILHRTPYILSRKRYSATTVREAAKKVAKILFLHCKDTTINFSIRETTIHSNKYIYHYEANKTNEKFNLHSKQKDHTIYIKNKLKEIFYRLYDSRYYNHQSIILPMTEFIKVLDYFHNKKAHNIKSITANIHHIQFYHNTISISVKYKNKQFIIKLIGE